MESQVENQTLRKKSIRHENNNNLPTVAEDKKKSTKDEITEYNLEDENDESNPKTFIKRSVSDSEMKQKLQNASVVELVLSNPSNTYTTDRPYRPQWLIPQQHEAYSWEPPSHLVEDSSKNYLYPENESHVNKPRRNSTNKRRESKHSLIEKKRRSSIRPEGASFRNLNHNNRLPRKIRFDIPRNETIDLKQDSSTRKSDFDYNHSTSKIDDREEIDEQHNMIGDNYQPTVPKNQRPSVHIPITTSVRKVSQNAYNLSRRSHYVQPHLSNLHASTREIIE